MALLKCSDCGNEVSLDAKQCPKCGTIKPFKKQVLSVEESKGLSYSERRAFQKGGGKLSIIGEKFGLAIKKGLKWIAISVGGIIAFSIVFNLLFPPKPLTPEESAKMEAIAKEEANAKAKEKEEEAKKELKKSAASSCRGYIDGRLNDPSGAEYDMSEMGTIVNQKENGVYVVRRSLKARNSFNALIPTTFECRFKQNGDSLNLLSLKEVK